MFGACRRSLEWIPIVKSRSIMCICQRWDCGGQMGKIIDKSILQMEYCTTPEENITEQWYKIQKKVPTGETMSEWNITWWMTLASTYMLHSDLQSWGSYVFWSKGKSSGKRSLRKWTRNLGWTGIVLGLDDINLQTEQLYYNYSVLIESLE